MAPALLPWLLTVGARRVLLAAAFARTTDGSPAAEVPVRFRTGPLLAPVLPPAATITRLDGIRRAPGNHLTMVLGEHARAVAEAVAAFAAGR